MDIFHTDNVSVFEVSHIATVGKYQAENFIEEICFCGITFRNLFFPKIK